MYELYILQTALIMGGLTRYYRLPTPMKTPSTYPLLKEQPQYLSALPTPPYQTRLLPG